MPIIHIFRYHTFNTQVRVLQSILSRKIACVSEIGYEFINNVMSANITFSAYKELKYKAYSMYNSYSKPFMSCASFIDCFYVGCQI